MHEVSEGLERHQSLWNTVRKLVPVQIETADLFLARAEKHARRAGTSLETAIQSLVGSVTDGDLHCLAAEFERIAFGDDLAARDAAKREALVAAGYSVWNLPGEASGDEGW